MTDAVSAPAASSSPSKLGNLRFVPPKGRYVTPFFFSVYYSKSTTTTVEDGSSPSSSGAAAALGWATPSSQGASLFSPYSSSPSGATEGGQTKWDPSDAIAADCTLLLSVTSTDTQEVLIPFQQAPLGRKIQLPRGNYVVKAQLLSFGGNVFAQKEASYEVLDSYEVPAHVALSSTYQHGDALPEHQRGISSSALFDQLEAMNANGGLPPSSLDAARGGKGHHVTSINFATPLARQPNTGGSVGGGERDSSTRVSRTGSMESGTGGAHHSTSSPGRPPLSRKQPYEAAGGKGGSSAAGSDGEPDGHTAGIPASGTAAHGSSASHLADDASFPCPPPPPRGFVLPLPSTVLLSSATALSEASISTGPSGVAAPVTFALEAPVQHMGSSFLYHVLVQRERRATPVTSSPTDNNNHNNNVNHRVIEVDRSATQSVPILVHAEAVRRWVGVPARGVALHWDTAPPSPPSLSSSSSPPQTLPSSGRWVTRGRGGVILGVAAPSQQEQQQQQQQQQQQWLTAATTSTEFFGATPREGVLSGFEFSVAPPFTESRTLIGFCETPPAAAPQQSRDAQLSLPYIVLNAVAHGGTDRDPGTQSVLLSVVVDGDDPEEGQRGVFAGAAPEVTVFHTEVTPSDVVSTLLEPVESALVAGHMRHMAAAASAHVQAFFVLSVNFEICAVLPVCKKRPLRHSMPLSTEGRRAGREPSSVLEEQQQQRRAGVSVQAVLAVRIAIPISSSYHHHQQQQQLSSLHHFYPLFGRFLPVSHHRCAADVVSRWGLPLVLPTASPANQRTDGVSGRRGAAGAEDEDMVVYVWRAGDPLSDSLKVTLVVV